jgi:putative PEP-CTERM system TPR-repeat lipoprotein
LAHEQAQALLRMAPDNATVLELAGSVELRRNALVLAESHLAKAVQLAPASALPRQLLAEVHIRSGQPQRALSVLGPLLNQTPTARALSLAGQAKLLMGDAAGAEASFARAAAINPDDIQVQSIIALSQIAAGRLDTGMAQLDRLSEQDVAQTYTDMARISARIDRREWRQALEAIDRLLEKTPASALPHHLRAQVLMQLNDSAGARTAWARTLAVDPAFFEAAAAVAMLDLSEGNASRAQQQVEAFLQANPRDARAMTAIADLRRRAGAPPDEVQRLLVEAISASAVIPGPRLLLVDHHLAQGNLSAALSTAQEAVAALPGDPMLLDALGRVQLAAGDSEQAINTFNRIVAAHPSQSQPMLRLADTHIRLRNFAAARQVLQRALDASPQLIDAQRELARVALLDGKPFEALNLARTVQQQRPAEPIG